MKNTTTALIASTLLTALFASSSAIADGDGNVFYSGDLANSVNHSIGSSPLSAKLDAELFPTDQSNYIGISDDRVNYSVKSAPISAELDADLFPEYNR